MKLTQKQKCKKCRYYRVWTLWGAISWCYKKDCFISRPGEYWCGCFENKLLPRLWNRLLRVRRL
jgi:hypothetical protein